MSEDRLFRAFAAVAQQGDFKVPPYPEVALHVRRVLANPDHSLAEVAKVAATDPALAAVLLATANSALYARRGPEVTNLARAVGQIGSRSASSIVLAAAMTAEATAAGPLVELKRRVWQRSMIAALFCQELAKGRALDPEDSFLAGLLHGFGRSVGLACLERLLSTHPPEKPYTWQQWLGAIEPQRAALAGVVARSWQLSGATAEAIVAHDAESASASPLSRLVTLADRLAIGLTRGRGVSDLSTALALSAAGRDTVSRFAPKLPEALQALVSCSPAEHRPKSDVIARPSAVLEGERRRFEAELTEQRVKGVPRVFPTSMISEDGVVALSSVALAEGVLMRLRLSRAGLNGWFNVLLCVPAQQGFVVELQPFAPSRDFKNSWLDLWQGAAPQA